jgi:hypothetical protein
LLFLSLIIQSIKYYYTEARSNPLYVFLHICIIWKIFIADKTSRGLRELAIPQIDLHRDFVRYWNPRLRLLRRAQSPHSGLLFRHRVPRHTRGLARRGSATSTTSSSSTTSGQAPRDYIDCARRTTSFHVGSATADKKAKCPSFKIQLLFIFVTKYLGTAPLHYYNKFTQILGGCVITLLPQIYSVTW